MTRKEIFMSVTKWALYSLVLALSYTIQVTMPFTVWQPYLALTVAVAVSFFENELSGVVFAAFAGILFIMALANAWELIEWGYAEADGGEVGAAFLGSQGDVWDAQKDMLCDTLGAVFAAFIFLANFRLPAGRGQ